MGLVTPVDPVPVDELGKVHFVAIGGAGMSGIARIMLSRGVTVSGSDSAASPLLDELADAGEALRLERSGAQATEPAAADAAASGINGIAQRVEAIAARLETS